MSLVGLSQELYCQILRRVNDDDEALEGLNKETAKYGRALREKYRQYRQAVVDVPLPLTPKTFFEELQKARTRERAFRGVQVEWENVCDKWMLDNWMPHHFAQTLKTLICDPNFKLQWKAPAIELRVDAELLFQFTTPEQNKLLICCNAFGNNDNILDCHIEKFTNERQAIQALHRALLRSVNTSNVSRMFQRRIIRTLIKASSLFSRQERHYCTLRVSADNWNEDIVKSLNAMSSSVFDVNWQKITFDIDFALHPDALQMCRKLGELEIAKGYLYKYYDYRLR